MDMLIRTHWEMVECLLDEINQEMHTDTVHDREVIYALFRYFIPTDERFMAAGIGWNPKGSVTYTDHTGYVFDGEGAIAAFLGLGQKVLRGRIEADHTAIAIIYKRFEDNSLAYDWIRWRVQKMHGFTDRSRELMRGYPRKFPELLQ